MISAPGNCIFLQFLRRIVTAFESIRQSAPAAPLGTFFFRFFVSLGKMAGAFLPAAIERVIIPPILRAGGRRRRIPAQICKFKNVSRGKPGLNHTSKPDPESPMPPPVRFLKIVSKCAQFSGRYLGCRSQPCSGRRFVRIAKCRGTDPSVLFEISGKSVNGGKMKFLGDLLYRHIGKFQLLF